MTRRGTKLVDMLAPGRVALPLEAGNKGEVLRALAELFAADDPALDTNAVLDVLLAREALATTGVGSGVAIPHGRLANLDAPRAALGIHPPGVDFDAVDGEKVRLFVAILAPEDQPSAHLKVLAEVGRCFRNEAFREAMLGAESVGAALALFEKLA